MSTSTERCDTDALLLVPPFRRRLANAPRLYRAEERHRRDAGGGTRTPDTRIMMPRLFGSGVRFCGSMGHGWGK